MAGVLKLFLISVVLLALGFCGWWYLATPQPPTFPAQMRYLKDTIAFQTHHFQRLPSFDFDGASTITQEEADFWLPMAQEGNSVAQIFVARYLFSQGEKNPRAYQTALTFLRPAAMDGIPVAQNALGVAYRYGLGVPQNTVEATKYFILAAARGLRLAQDNLYQMSRQITPDEMKEAKARSQQIQ